MPGKRVKCQGEEEEGDRKWRRVLGREKGGRLWGEEGECRGEEPVTK